MSAAAIGAAAISILGSSPGSDAQTASPSVPAARRTAASPLGGQLGSAALPPRASESQGSTATGGLGRLRQPGVADTTTAAPRTAAVPVRLRIPAIAVDTSLQRLHLMSDGTLQTPTAWGRAGWFVDGPVPGQVGPAVIAGHIDSVSGPAVFYRLTQLRLGATVRVTLDDSRVLTFVVDGMRRFAKKHFPTDVVYGPTPDPELRLITCTGRFDRNALSYVDNLVVSAHLQ